MTPRNPWDKWYAVIVVCAMLAMTALTVHADWRFDRAAKDRDAYRTQVTALVRGLLRDCVVRPDGSLDSCKAGTVFTPTTTVSLP